MKTRLSIMFAMALIPLYFLAPLVQAERFETITTDELLEVRRGAAPFLLINALSPIEHNEEAIHGSVNIPASHMRPDHPLLPKDKSTLLIFYCKGLRCTKSRSAARMAMDFGYKHVKIYTPGLPGWKHRDLPLIHATTYPDIDPPILEPLTVYKKMDTALLLDIRGEEVSQLGEIKKALKIPLDDMDHDYRQLPHDKTIIIIDHAEKQSPICARFLAKMGYQDLAILKGGMINWVRAGLPIE
ncbi:MAG: rhodanese-like domain-containing protein [Proteobacteria bacterium]|nr:rhodanese-like domain-containing protein [Pseudomonadota bacterium]MBU1640533.1 rhodanese-like domain-containing protein [Pseudomonadota bacterium]